MLRDQVLEILELNKGRIVTGGELSRLLGVSRTAVWKAVRALRKGGGEIIEPLPGRGYLLTEESDGLSGRVIAGLLRTDKFGRELEIFPAIPSTNQYLKEMADRLPGEGHAVLADAQTAGRGRLGRPFFSPAREGIYLSLLLRPKIPSEDIQFLTICAAVAVCRALEVVCGLKPGIKWVNDIFLNGKKLCGILTEASISAEMGCADYVIVGIGLNTGRVPAEAADMATSVYEAAGMRGIRGRLTAEILNQFEPVYISYTERGCRDGILGAYSERLCIIGCRAETSQAGERRTGYAVGLDERGRLIVELDGGERFSVNAGEVRFL